MARISEGQGPSNNPTERWRVLSLGTSSSTSGSMPDKSGTSGMIDLQLPAHDADSPSSRDPHPRPTSSSAPTTDGSGHETGSSPWSPPDSSEDSAQQREATPDPVLEADEQNEDDPYEGLSGAELMHLARDAYEARDLDETSRILDRAEAAGGVPPAELATARSFVARARAVGASPRGPEGSAPTPAGPSEADPAAGGYLADR